MQRFQLSIAFLTKVLAFLAIFLGFCYLFFQESQLKRPEQLFITQAGSVDMCLSCHGDVKLDPAHDPKVIGCTPCHLGDPLAITENEAHKGIVLNPGDLRHARKTCSVEGCHPKDLVKVKNSLMATNRGILGTLLYYWGESDSQDTDLTVEDLLSSDKTSLALDYYRKLCATCHLWKQKNDMDGVPQFFNEKGGGCTACHYHTEEKTNVDSLLISDASDFEETKEESKKKHPTVTRKVSSVNCVRCHNRSGRIGISYMGIYESEGYATPFEGGKHNSRQLPGARFYLEIADDIHHAKGMECIDCHTRDEVMGDGTSYAHYEEQLEISCEVCHSETPGKTRKGAELTNVENEEGKNILIGKIDEKVRPLRPPKKGVCDFTPHKRVTCEACHSTWVAQCYGCHAKRDERETHLDKLSLTETAGMWEEGRSYIRYEKPMLGVWGDEIVVMTPGCQDIVTVIDKNGKIEKSFNRFTMAAINPHTTQAKGRECADCHASTKTVGLGEGSLVVKDGKLSFEPLDRGVDTSAGQTVGFDSYVNLEGEPLQYSSRAEIRPFNKKELRAILRVGLCIRCHDTYKDRVWADFSDTSICSDPEGKVLGSVFK